MRTIIGTVPMPMMNAVVTLKIEKVKHIELNFREIFQTTDIKETCKCIL